MPNRPPTPVRLGRWEFSEQELARIYLVAVGAIIALVPGLALAAVRMMNFPPALETPIRIIAGIAAILIFLSFFLARRSKKRS